MVKGKFMDTQKNAEKDNKVKTVAAQKMVYKRVKPMLASLAAFLLAGGLIFIFMIFVGSKGLKQDEIKFSYGNIIRGAFSPINEFFSGSVDADKEDFIERERMRSRGMTITDEVISLDDWFEPESRASAQNSSGRPEKYSRPASSSYSGMPQNYGKMSEGSAGDMYLGNNTQTSAQLKSFSYSGTDGDVINTGSGQQEHSSAIKKTNNGASNSKLKSMQVLQKTRADLSTALTSGSAFTAKANWGSSFDGSKTANFKKGAGGKLSGAAYLDKGLTALDDIKSGEIGNLKEKIDATKGSSSSDVPSVNEAKADGDKKDSKDESSDLSSILDGVSNLLTDLISGKNKDKKQGEEKGAETATEESITRNMPDIGFEVKNPPNEVKQIMDGQECRANCSRLYDGGQAITFEDTQVSYYVNKNGEWTVKYKGKYTIVDTEKGERGETKDYEDTFVMKVQDKSVILQSGEIYMKEIKQKDVNKLKVPSFLAPI